MFNCIGRKSINNILCFILEDERIGIVYTHEQAKKTGEIIENNDKIIIKRQKEYIETLEKFLYNLGRTYNIDINISNEYDKNVDKGSKTWSKFLEDITTQLSVIVKGINKFIDISIESAKKKFEEYEAKQRQDIEKEGKKKTIVI